MSENLYSALLYKSYYNGVIISSTHIYISFDKF
jgi:hypothetical protein